MLVKAGTIVAQFQHFKQVQVSELPIGSADSKVSTVNSSSMNVELHIACAFQHGDSNLQHKA